MTTPMRVEYRYSNDVYPGRCRVCGPGERPGNIQPFYPVLVGEAGEEGPVCADCVAASAGERAARAERCAQSLEGEAMAVRARGAAEWAVLGGPPATFCQQCGAVDDLVEVIHHRTVHDLATGAVLEEEGRHVFTECRQCAEQPF